MTTLSDFSHIPIETSSAAKVEHSSDNLYLLIGQRLTSYLANSPQSGVQLMDASFQTETPSLTMVTILEYIEKLTDDQATEATRTRTDWKYALHLSMSYPGLPRRALGEFRQHLLSEPANKIRFQQTLNRITEDGLPSAYHNKQLEADDVLDELCSMTRLDWISTAMQVAINALAASQPAWLRRISLPRWYSRYQAPSQPFQAPLDKTLRRAYMETVGADIYYLLRCFTEDAKSDWPLYKEVQALQNVALEQFDYSSGGHTTLLERCSFCKNAISHPINSSE